MRAGPLVPTGRILGPALFLGPRWRGFFDERSEAEKHGGDVWDWP